MNPPPQKINLHPPTNNIIQFVLISPPSPKVRIVFRIQGFPIKIPHLLHPPVIYGVAHPEPETPDPRDGDHDHDGDDTNRGDDDDNDGDDHKGDDDKGEQEEEVEEEEDEEEEEGGG